MFHYFFLELSLSRVLALFVLCGIAAMSVAGSALADRPSERWPEKWEEGFLPCSPASEAVGENGVTEDLWTSPSLSFCAEWNPEFAANGHHCCGKLVRGRSGGRRRTKPSCSKGRRPTTYCEEMTQEQSGYAEAVLSGRLPNVLDLVLGEAEKRDTQSYCSPNNGFLVQGRRLIPTAENRILLRSPQRCTEFGTDPMIGMLEWLGREVGKRYPKPEYSGVRLVAGDISAPRGGCLAGHVSHTNGRDADIGFLSVKRWVQSPLSFHRGFDPVIQFWLFKKLFKNPFACIKVVFLDGGHIRKLAASARRDPEWDSMRRFIRHMPGHRNHWHVRIGDRPGPGACSLIDDEAETPDFEDEGGELDLFERVPEPIPSEASSQGSDI